MNKLQIYTLALAKASRGNPVVSTCTVIIFYVMLSFCESQIEFLIFGERFVHWLDPVFNIIFISYSAYAVWYCAALNESEERDKP